MDYIKKVLEQHNINYMNYLTKEFREGITELTNVMQSSDVNVLYDHLTNDNKIVADCIFRKNCASVPEERSAIPLQTEQSSAG